jgi:hypothetical protein
MRFRNLRPPHNLERLTFQDERVRGHCIVTVRALNFLNFERTHTFINCQSRRLVFDCDNLKASEDEPRGRWI